MKVELNEVENVFQPVTISVTIESAHEWMAIYNLACFNIAISELVIPKNKEIVLDFLNEMRTNLLTAKENVK